MAEAGGFGITQPWNQVEPAGYVQEVSRDFMAEPATIKDVLGVTRVAKTKPRSETKVVAKAKGEVDIGEIASGQYLDNGQFYVIGWKFTESQDDFATTEYTILKLE